MLVNITGGKDLTLFEVDQAVNKVRAEVDTGAELIIGAITDTNLEGKMRVSIVATALDGQVPDTKSVVSMIHRINNRNYVNNSAPNGSSNVVATQGHEQVLFDGESIADNDWIASFNGDVCVGAKKWGDCEPNEDICELVASGSWTDPIGCTDNYLQTDDDVIFQIYIASEGEYYTASISEAVIPYENFEIQIFTAPLAVCSDGEIPNSGGNCD